MSFALLGITESLNYKMIIKWMIIIERNLQNNNRIIDHWLEKPKTISKENQFFSIPTFKIILWLRYQKSTSYKRQNLEEWEICKFLT